MNKTFKPLDLLQSIMKQWWMTSISMIVGGFCALLLTQFLSPKYEGSASFSVTIDYTRTGSLSDVQEDQAMRGIGYVITSDEVIDTVVDEVQLLQNDYSKDQFEKESTIDREEFQWTMRYRSSDPKYAEKIAAFWADISFSVIQEGLMHAQIVDSETELLWGLQDCLERVTGPFGKADLCVFNNTQEIIQEIAQMSKSIIEEKKQSRGLFTFLTVHFVQHPQYPNSPIRHQTSLLTGAGIIVGMIMNIIIQGIIFYRGSSIEE